MLAFTFEANTFLLLLLLLLPQLVALKGKWFSNSEGSYATVKAWVGEWVNGWMGEWVNGEEAEKWQ